jgi:hypothetical protein
MFTHHHHAPASVSAADASAVLACREFAALRRDADAGIVADAEARPRVQALYANARLADAALAPDVQAAAAGLLVSATVSGQADAAAAVARLATACKSAVWDRGAQ